MKNVQFFFCYSGTHTLWLYEIHLVKPMMIIQQQKKMSYIFAHITPCQVAGRLMYHFLLLQWTSICHNSQA